MKDSEKEAEKLASDLQGQKMSLEKLQNQQSEDSRGISKQQKHTERYLAKKNMLMGRKDECNRNIRDLGVLPEEAFEKYTSEKLDRVGCLVPHANVPSLCRVHSSSKNCTSSMRALRNSLTSTKRPLNSTIISRNRKIPFFSVAKT